MTTPQTDGGFNTGPIVRRLLLGSRLRQLREARGLTRDQAGWEIRASESKISRMELGRVSFKERDVADLLTLYGVTESAQRDELLELTRQANTPGWWHEYADLLTPWFQSYLGLEAAATVIRSYELQFIPGLLQTEDYARAVVSIGHPHADPAEIDRRVALRMARRRLLDGPSPPKLWAVIDEAALRRPIGGAAVMRAQIDALIAATRLPAVQLQVVQFRTGGHAATGGAFSILRYGEPELPDVVYFEQLTAGHFIEKRDDVDHYAAAMDQLCLQATPPAQTAAVLAELRDHIEG